MKLGRTGELHELDDLGVLPKEEWYKKMGDLIEAIGYEEYRNHIESSLKGIIKLMTASKRLDKRREIDRSNLINRRITEYVDSGEYKKIQLPPYKFYFYYSEKGRYLRGLILSISCLPDPILLKLLEDFAVKFPFATHNTSQGPTGLFTYDALEVFYRLGYPDGISYITNLKAKIKQTWAQKRFEKKLKDIAKEFKVSYEDIIEIGVSDYGFDSDHVFKKTLGSYEAHLSFPSLTKKELYWVDLRTGKQQKSIPKDLKESSPESLKYLKKHIKDIENQIVIYSKRLESYYLNSKVWNTKEWLERFIKHPFIGMIGKRLLWNLHVNDKITSVLYDSGGNFVDKNRKVINVLDYHVVSLWHPLLGENSDKDDVVKRAGSKISDQPFKQLGRETYGVNFIEDSLGIVLKKPTLSQLCKNRGWTSSSIHKLKIPSLKLEFELLLKEVNDGSRGMYSGSSHVEFKGIQIRRSKKEISPEEINKVVLSEVCRDLDLFISKSRLV